MAFGGGMKKIVIVISVICILATGVISFYIGYLTSIYNSDMYFLDSSKRKNELQKRTDLYSPSCEELKNLNIPNIVKKGDDYFFVHATNDYFRVFGINISPGKAPETYWWGAGRREALKQVCGE